MSRRRHYRHRNMDTADTDLIVHELRERGHIVKYVVAVAENAGRYLFDIDGEELSVAGVRALLEKET